MSFQNAVIVVQTILLILLGFALSNLLLRVQRLEGVGTQRSDHPWSAVLGEPVPAMLRSSVPEHGGAAAIFLSSDCAVCHRVMGALVAATDRLSELSGPLVVAIDGPALKHLTPEAERELGDCHVYVQQFASGVFRSFGVPVTPFAMVFVDGHVTEAGTFHDVDEVIGMLGQADVSSLDIERREIS